MHQPEGLAHFLSKQDIFLVLYVELTANIYFECQVIRLPDLLGCTRDVKKGWLTIDSRIIYAGHISEWNDFQINHAR